MTSIRIHEDKENQNVAIRQKDGSMAGHPRRTALGAIENLQIKDKQTKKNKQRPQIPLTHATTADDKENGPRNNNGEKRLVIPVAQFEAFKVYEDNMKITGGRPVMPDVDEFYKHSNALITKKDLMIMTFGEEKKKLSAREFNQILRNRRPNLDDSSDSIFEDEPAESKPAESKPSEDEASPMNISFIDKTPKPEFKVKPEEPKSERDVFFDVEEYRADIYQYLRHRELQNRPKPGYMRKQPDITYQMRSVLVDWLVEVASEYKMGSETWYLAVNLLDRFLSYMSVVRGKLQLVGTAAIFIAAKYEEIYTPDIKEYVYITADTYCRRQIIRMEQLILKILNFDISVPTPYTFMNCLCSMLNISEEQKQLALYICEMSALETDEYIETLPSVLAASAIAVARYTLDEEMWPQEFTDITNYDVKHLKQGIEFLSRVHVAAPTHPQRAIPDKYAQDTYNNVSKIEAKLITLTEDCSND